MFGDSVELTDDYRWWWPYIPHFIHTPFYCYAYGFGELLVLALYGATTRRAPPSCRATSSCSPPAAPSRRRRCSPASASTSRTPLLERRPRPPSSDARRGRAPRGVGGTF